MLTSLPARVAVAFCVLLVLCQCQPPAAVGQSTPAPSSAFSPVTPDGSAAPAQSQKRYVTENGIRYMETRTKYQQPVRDYKYVEMPQTVYMQRYRTDVVNQTATNYVANTKYECVPRLYDWWRVMGVYGQPYVAYGMEPSTTYQPVTQNQRVPVTTREVKQQTQMAKVAVPYVRMVEREQVSRVALGPATSQTNIASSPTGILASRPERYPGQPQRPTYLPVNGSNGLQPGQAPPGATIDPYDDNPFGGWGVANRRNGIEPFADATDGNGNGNLEKRAGIWPIGGIQPAGAANNGLENGFGQNGQGDGLGPYGGTAQLDGDFPRYGTGPNYQPAFQARR